MLNAQTPPPPSLYQYYLEWLVFRFLIGCFQSTVGSLQAYVWMLDFSFHLHDITVKLSTFYSSSHLMCCTVYSTLVVYTNEFCFPLNKITMKMSVKKLPTGWFSLGYLYSKICYSLSDSIILAGIYEYENIIVSKYVVSRRS